MISVILLGALGKQILLKRSTVNIAYVFATMGLFVAAHSFDLRSSSNDWRSSNTIHTDCDFINTITIIFISQSSRASSLRCPTFAISLFGKTNQRQQLLRCVTPLIQNNEGLSGASLHAMVQEIALKGPFK